jgi:hypothetical protein
VFGVIEELAGHAGSGGISSANAPRLDTQRVSTCPVAWCLFSSGTKLFVNGKVPGLA